MSDPQPLSKNAVKKAAKAERFAANKLERRAREKQAKKEKKQIIAAKRAAGELDDTEDKKRHNKRPRLHFGGQVVVDLGFDEMMSDKEIVSLCSQLAYTYSANRNAAFPFDLIFTSLNGRTFSRLEGVSGASYKRWTHTQWWHEGYERLWQCQAPSDAHDSRAHNLTASMDIEISKNAQRNANEALDLPTTPPSETNIECRKGTQQNVVYLTADSEEELAELKPEETYIIGGICDHNRYKNLCLNKAKGSGIRTARLPIGRYLASLTTRKVLTVNQVFEILIKWVETKSWEDALYSVVPKRKFQMGGEGGSKATEETDSLTNTCEEHSSHDQLHIQDNPVAATKEIHD